MIKKIEIISTGENKYLYENEVKILLKMLNNNINTLEINSKIFKITKQKNNFAIVKIYKLKKILFVYLSNKLVTELKIKYS